MSPHGQREPEAPGCGQNEDGFYEFGTLPSAGEEPVLIRDDGSGVVFGPSGSGVRHQVGRGEPCRAGCHADGRDNGDGNDQATAVGVQIRAQAIPTDGQWTAAVGFIKGWADPPWLMVLGQAGFFDRFTVVMSRLSQALAIEDQEHFDRQYGDLIPLAPG